MESKTVRYIRLVWIVALIAAVCWSAFFSGYRLGWLQGYAELESTLDGVRVRMVPIDEPEGRKH